MIPTEYELNVLVRKLKEDHQTSLKEYSFWENESAELEIEAVRLKKEADFILDTIDDLDYEVSEATSTLDLLDSRICGLEEELSNCIVQAQEWAYDLESFYTYEELEAAGQLKLFSN